jgi:hypothetical protein
LGNNPGTIKPDHNGKKLKKTTSHGKTVAQSIPDVTPKTKFDPSEVLYAGSSGIQIKKKLISDDKYISFYSIFFIIPSIQIGRSFRNRSAMINSSV